MLSIIINCINKITSSHLIANGAGGYSSSNFDSGAGVYNIAYYINQLILRFAEIIKNFGLTLYKFLMHLIYYIIELSLNIIDFIFLCIKELTGQSQGFNIKNTSLEESDIIFRFLLNDLTIKILTRVFFFSLFIMVIVTIIAIVKNEWTKGFGGKGRANKQIFKKVIIALFWMFLTPFMLIIGIVFSNAVIGGALGLLNGGNSSSYNIGAAIFQAGAYDSNWYRVYADANQKIPILFNYNGGFEIAINPNYVITSNAGASGIDKQVQNILDDINKDDNDVVLGAKYTDYMFKNNKYYNFNKLPENYYDYYDSRMLVTNRLEYYVMADFVDFAMQSGSDFYIVNVEDVYSRAVEISNRDKTLYIDNTEASGEYYHYFNNIFQNITPYTMVNKSAVEYLYQDNASNYNSGNVNHYSFKVYYNSKKIDEYDNFKNYSYDKSLNEYYIEYNSYASAKDELEGAKYLYCHKVKITTKDGLTEYLYVPIQQATNYNKLYTFKSKFLSEASSEQDIKRSNCLFVARGGFDTNGYPTAIRQDGENIVFYRHTISTPTTLNFLPSISYKQPGDNGIKDESMSIDGFLEYVTGVDFSQLLPEINVELNALVTYAKEIKDVSTLKNGLYKLNYSFVGSGVKLENVYDPLHVNFVILFFLSSIFMFKLVTILFELIARLLEITILWITYPAFLAGTPIETADDFALNSTRFGNWRNHLFNKLLTVYEVYLSFALIFAIIPLVFSLEIDMTTLDTSKWGFLFSFITADAMALFLKSLIIVVFVNGYTVLTEIIRFIVMPGIEPITDQDGVFNNIFGKKGLFKNTKSAIQKGWGKVKTGYDLMTLDKSKWKSVSRNTLQKGASYIPGVGLVSSAVMGVTNKISDNNMRNDASNMAIRTSGLTTPPSVLTSEAHILGNKTNKYRERQSSRAATMDRLNTPNV